MLAFAMVHEMPSAEAFFREARAALKPGGLMLLAEPAGHVKPEGFQIELEGLKWLRGLKFTGAWLRYCARHRAQVFHGRIR